MNPIQSSASSILTLETGRTIRDTIFYFEDLMGSSSIDPDPVRDRIPDLTIETLMNHCFDEAMIDQTHAIQDPKREQTIRDLLISIDAFRNNGFEE